MLGSDGEAGVKNLLLLPTKAYVPPLLEEEFGMQSLGSHHAHTTRINNSIDVLAFLSHVQAKHFRKKPGFASKRNIDMESARISRGFKTPSETENNA